MNTSGRPWPISNSKDLSAKNVLSKIKGFSIGMMILMIAIGSANTSLDAQIEREEVQFPSLDHTFQLAGTLYFPSQTKTSGCAILISGSGPQDRNESIFQKKPFLAIATYLCTHGLAVLCYDDRGIGASGGVFWPATSADFAQDAEAAYAFVSKHKRIQPNAIGFIGHSEGGAVAAMAAAKTDAAFVISLAGCGFDGERVIQKQKADILRASGFGQAEIDAELAKSKSYFIALEKEPNDSLAKIQLTDMIRNDLYPKKELIPNFDTTCMQIAEQMCNPWWRYFLQHDCSQDWKKLKCPVLALNGLKDLQVNEENLQAISDAVMAGGNNDVETIAFPGLNHLFEETQTGLPSEYENGETLFSELVLQEMVSWLLKKRILPRG